MPLKDGSVNMLKEKFPQVTIIENRENLGYGNAHNQAIQIAKGRHMLFLNPDTEMFSDTLYRVLQFMDNHPEAGACTCREIMHREDRSEVVVFTKFRHLMWSVCTAIHRRFPNSLTAYYCGNFITKALIASHSGYIATKQPALEGGFLLLRKEALRQVGGFDSKFFHGSEGTDLTQRIRKLGWKLYRIPTIKIIHYWNMSINKMSDSEFINLNSDWQKHKVLHKRI